MKKRIRIEFSDIRLYEGEQPENPGGPGDGSGGDPGDGTVREFPDCGIRFSLEGEDLPGYGPVTPAIVSDSSGRNHPAMNGWPGGEVAFAVPAEDLPRVRAWFSGDYHGVTLPESATLQKNRRTAVHAALAGYFDRAAMRNLFSSPFRIGWCYRLFDGSLTPLRGISLLQTCAEAPLLPIVTASVSDKALTTSVEIRNIPSRLYMELPGLETLDGFRDVITSIEIYATACTPLYDPEGGVSGVRSVATGEGRTRCWHYDRFTAEEVALKAAGDWTFRHLCSLPAEGLAAGTRPLPLEAGTLTGFAKRPVYKGGGASAAKPGAEVTPDAGWRPYVNVATEALHLGDPERGKRVSQLILRGVFRREAVKLRLYGSHHREDRRLLASASGPVIAGLCPGRYRWYFVEIECPMRKDDFLEALTFVIST